jgi:hypothetical protein
MWTDRPLLAAMVAAADRARNVILIVAPVR